MIKDFQIIIPDKKMMTEFENKTVHIFNKIRQKQIRTLDTFRDMLLPKLMGSEVRVKA